MFDINKTIAPLLITIALVMYIYRQLYYSEKTAENTNFLLFFIFYTLAIILNVLIEISDKPSKLM